MKKEKGCGRAAFYCTDLRVFIYLIPGDVVSGCSAVKLYHDESLT
jgi:hypothetical protein